MDKLLDSHRSLSIFLTLSLCLISMVICEVIDPLIARDGLLTVDLQGGSLLLSHLDEHDDDFVLIDPPCSDSMKGHLLSVRSSRILAYSYKLSPIIPPPKAA